MASYSKILVFFAWILIAASVIWTFFAFMEDGLSILNTPAFWTFMNTLWILAILLFTIENRIKK
jgi:hypothetical protein